MYLSQTYICIKYKYIYSQGHINTKPLINELIG